MTWRADEIVHALVSSLKAREAQLFAEHAVYGLDALDEVDLHPLLADGLRHAGFSAFREVPYPGQPERLPRESERQRCDLVIGPAGTAGIADIVQWGKELQRAEQTLFASLAKTRPSGLLPQDAFWLEVKSVAQIGYVEGVPVPNRSYASQLVRGPALDLIKLAREPLIESAGVAVIVFGAEAPLVRHDLQAMATALIDRDLPISSPTIEILPIADRVGNACAGVCLVPLRAARD
ncbi:MAG: hypothetical protein D6695_01610 [Planctomycetota bacterium]|nr:MAG: hypothetical protein D6695_01610 [Planctomycetota bacterium]